MRNSPLNRLGATDICLLCLLVVVYRRRLPVTIPKLVWLNVWEMVVSRAMMLL